MSTVVGIDTSLTSTGIVVLSGADHDLHRVRSAGKKDDDLRARRARLDQMAGRITSLVMTAQPDFAVIEQPAFSRTQGHMHDRSGLWWLVVFALTGRGVPVLEVSPSGRAKYATGRGNSSKDEVLTAVVRRYSSIQVAGNDQADALLLAAIGRRLLGDPIEDSLPQANLEVLRKLELPLGVA